MKRPTPAWQTLFAAMPQDQRRVHLADVLKTRVRTLPISVNGKTQHVPRAEVRDFLRAIA